MKLINDKLIIRELDEHSIQLFTGNSYIKKTGELVQGRGIARYVRDTFNQVPAELGKQIKHMSVYGLKFTNITGFWIGAFQVKRHYAKPAELSIVQYSTDALHTVAQDHPDMTFHMNYPAIGYGRMDVTDIEPIVNSLPDNVILYKI